MSQWSNILILSQQCEIIFVGHTAKEVDLEEEILEVAALEDVEEMEVAFEAEEVEVFGAAALVAAALAVVSETVEVVHFTTNSHNYFTLLQSLFVGQLKASCLSVIIPIRWSWWGPIRRRRWPFWRTRWWWWRPWKRFETAPLGQSTITSVQKGFLRSPSCCRQQVPIRSAGIPRRQRNYGGR